MKRSEYEEKLSTEVNKMTPPGWVKKTNETLKSAKSLKNFTKDESITPVSTNVSTSVITSEKAKRNIESEDIESIRTDIKKLYKQPVYTQNKASVVNKKPQKVKLLNFVMQIRISLGMRNVIKELGDIMGMKPSEVVRACIMHAYAELKTKVLWQ
jgi:hypothetical protein